MWPDVHRFFGYIYTVCKIFSKALLYVISCTFVRLGAPLGCFPARRSFLFSWRRNNRPFRVLSGTKELFYFRGGGTTDHQCFLACTLSRSGSARGHGVPDTYLPAHNPALSQGHRDVHDLPAQNLRCRPPCQRSLSVRRHAEFGGRYRIESAPALYILRLSVR